MERAGGSLSEPGAGRGAEAGVAQSGAGCVQSPGLCLRLGQFKVKIRWKVTGKGPLLLHNTHSQIRTHTHGYPRVCVCVSRAAAEKPVFQRNQHCPLLSDLA